MSSSNTYNSPCAACKFLRRKCLPECSFAPYFPPEEPTKFANVHKIFGASNISKLLNEILPDQREDAVKSLAYEAEARIRDPVYGCVGTISFLQKQVERLEKELCAANVDLMRYACSEIVTPPVMINANKSEELISRSSTHEESLTFHETPPCVPFGYPLHWNENNNNTTINNAGDGSF